MSLISLSPRRLSNVQCPFQSQSSSLVDMTPLSISVKYKSLEKTILGQVYGKMLSFFITAHHCVYSSFGFWWAKLSALSNGSLCLSSLPVFTPVFSGSQHSEAYLPHSQKLFQQKGEGLPFSTLQNFTFRAAQWQKGRGLQLQKVVLCRSKSCTNCSVPAAPLSIQ